MLFLLLAILILALLYISFRLYLSHVIELYLQDQTHHLKTVGMDESDFIGLHKKELDLKDAYMIYARKTTAYKGVILFTPDIALNYRFYMPFINFLCRQGYIITTYQTAHTFYSESVEDLKKLYQYILNDEILKTYPLSCLGHGTGALAQMASGLENIQTMVSLQPSIQEIDAIMAYSNYNKPFIKENLIKMIQKKYHVNTELNLSDTTNVYVICGQQDTKPYLSCFKQFKQLPNVGHYPFLHIDSEQHIKSIECVLAYPSTSQFEYNKLLKTFDTSVLTNMNQELLEIIPYLFLEKDLNA